MFPHLPSLHWFVLSNVFCVVAQFYHYQFGAPSVLMTRILGSADLCHLNVESVVQRREFMKYKKQSGEAVQRQTPH